MRFQGYTSEHDSEGVCLNETSFYVDKDNADPRFSLDCSDHPSLTRQEFADECDINKLMAQYEKTGILPANNPMPPRYLDVSDVPDLPQALNLLNEATTAFMSLPATVRRDFDNDPVKFIQFAENSENLPKLREWKLAPEAPQEPPPQKVEIINPPSILDPDAKAKL
ncbi:internal scaffolding protein [Blackfly microvirus SF02]|uniref:Internal scaffolding protein n=1 Tax=Blackfly microvirus SF02 TaxID=2576452 RepID=A0A4P8PPT4_9VIRU|nr:internal scaffolding protein [Blackfly microvirus SF02]